MLKLLLVDPWTAEKARRRVWLVFLGAKSWNTVGEPKGSVGGGGAALDETTHRKAGKPKLVRHVSLAVQGPGLAGDGDGVQQIQFGIVHVKTVTN